MAEKQASDKKEQEWVSPVHAKNGDAELVLDTATALQVHSAFLVVESPVLVEAVTLAQQRGQDKLRLPLPSTSVEEAQALVSFLYSTRRESYALGLPLDRLRLLVNICHQFAFQGLLDIVEQALARHAGTCCPPHVQPEAQPAQFLTPENAPELYWVCHSKGLKTFQAACANYIAANLELVADKALTDDIGPLLAVVARTSCRLTTIEEELGRVKNWFQASSTASYNGNYVRDSFDICLKNFKRLMS